MCDDERLASMGNARRLRDQKRWYDANFDEELLRERAQAERSAINSTHSIRTTRRGGAPCSPICSLSWGREQRFFLHFMLITDTTAV